MMLFTDRKALAKLYRKWLRQHNAIDCAENFIAYLCENNLMDLDATDKFLEVAQNGMQ
jgi:hypothetical protein